MLDIENSNQIFQSNHQLEADLYEAIQEVKDGKVISHEEVMAKIQIRINESLKLKNIQ